MDDLGKLLDIKVTQIQLVKDRGYDISEQDKLILKNEEEVEDLSYFYDYLLSLKGNINEADYWKNHGFLTEKAIDYLGNNLNNYVTKTLKPLFLKANEHQLNWHQYWNADFSRSMLVYYDVKGNTQVSNVTVKTFKNIIDQAEELYAKIRKTSRYDKIMEGVLIVNAKLSPEANKEMNEITRGQVFLESELSFNPTLSIDNQRYSLIPKDDVKDLLKNLRADKHGLETFKANDPTIKYYGWKEGDIIKVNRTDYGVSILSPDSVNYKLVVAVTK